MDHQFAGSGPKFTFKNHLRPINQLFQLTNWFLINLLVLFYRILLTEFYIHYWEISLNFPLFKPACLSWIKSFVRRPLKFYDIYKFYLKLFSGVSHIKFGDFVQFLWPSQNTWTLRACITIKLLQTTHIIL